MDEESELDLGMPVHDYASVSDLCLSHDCCLGAGCRFGRKTLIAGTVYWVVQVFVDGYLLGRLDRSGSAILKLPGKNRMSGNPPASM